MRVDLDTLNAGLVYLMTTETGVVFETVGRGDDTPDVRPCRLLMTDPDSSERKKIGRCNYCNDRNCTRWIVVVGGVQVVSGQHVLDPVPH